MEKLRKFPKQSSAVGVLTVLIRASKCVQVRSRCRADIFAAIYHTWWHLPSKNHSKVNKTTTFTNGCRRPSTFFAWCLQDAPEPATATQASMATQMSPRCPLYMMIIYDDHIWRSYMMLMNDDHIWWSYMIITYEDYNEKDTRSFSGSYSTDFNNSCGKFDLIAARSRL